MKKFILFALSALTFIASHAQIKKVPYRGAFAPSPVVPWTDKWANFDPQNTVYPNTTVSIGRPANTNTAAGAVITTNTTWTKNNVYELCGLVYVTNGATLTIEAGTVIRGSVAYANSSLVICKGAKLIARGTPDLPIVFTSNNPVGLRGPGNWGGIILLGRASYNGTSSSTSPVASTYGINYIEGITEIGATLSLNNGNISTGASTEFGGGSSPNDNDTSGVLKYVRIEFGGYIFAQNKEINGLTFGAVGRGTTIDFVQSSFINDDAFEWFGGTVNCSHLISYRGVDDEWDTDNGFSGTVQFCLGVRDPQIGDNTYAQASGGSTSEGYESDNDANGSDNYPKTKALFSNITNIGPLRGDNSSTNQAAIYPAFRRAARIRRNSELKIFNSILSDYPVGLMVDNSLGNTAQRYVGGQAKFKNNIISGVKSGGLTETSGTLPSGFNARTFVFANSNDSALSANSFLTRPYGTATYPNAATFTNADYRPIATGLAATGADFTDSSFTLGTWTADTCTAPATPSSISGSTTINSLSDTLKTYSVTNDASVNVYLWTISGTGNSIVSGQGTNSISVVVKNPGTVSVTGTNFCAISAASTLNISCATPTAPTEIRGDSSIAGGADTLRAFAVNAQSGVSHIWSISGSGNYILSGQGTDSVIVVAKNTGLVSVVSSIGCSISAAYSVALVCNKPVVATSEISGPKNIVSCVSALQTYSVVRTPGYTYSWIITGTGNGIGGSLNAIGDSVTAAVIAAGTITCTANTGCQLVTPVTLSIVKSTITTVAPTITAISPLSCGARIYRFNSGTTTPVGVNSFNWSFKGTLGQSATFVRDSAGGRYVWYSFSSNAAATTTDSIVVTYNLDCGGLSSSKATKLTNTLLGAPSAPASITATAVVTNVCGSRVYRYAAPAIPISTTAPAITGYEWVLPYGSTLATTAVLDSGDLSGPTARYIKVRYSSNAAAGANDSIKVRYTYACGSTTFTRAKLSLTALNTPAAPASITITALPTINCGQPRYRYSVPTTPAATTTAGVATGYQWAFIGSLGASFVVDSGTLASRVLTGYFTSTSIRTTGDSVKCRYTSDCGNGTYKASALTNVATSTNAPAVPASITATLVENVCGARIYRFAAPALPAGTSLNAQPTGYEWFLPTTGSSVALSATLDSGDISGVNARYIRVKFTENGAAAIGDSIKVRYTSLCGNGSTKGLKLTNTALTCFTNNEPVFSKQSTLSVNNSTATVYPNPNNGIFTLKVATGKFEIEKAMILVIDVTGKIVNQKCAYSNNGILMVPFENATLPNGIYTIKYTIGNISKSVRMIVNR